MYINQSRHLDPQDARPPHPYTTEPMKSEPGLRIDVVKSLRLHPLVAITVTLFTLAVGLAFLLHHRPSYTATAAVYVSPVSPKTLTEDRENQFPYDPYFQEQMHTVTRYDVLAAAIKKTPRGTWQEPGESERLAVERLEHALEITRNGLSYQMLITIRGAQPQHLAEMVNAVAKTYVDKNRDDEFFGQDERLGALQDERKKIQSDLDAKLEELDAVTESLGVAMVNSIGADSYDDQVSRLRSNLSTARAQRIQAEAQLSSLESGGADSALNATADEIIASDPSLTAMKTSLAQKRSTLINELAALKPNHPVRRETEEELAQIEASLDKMQTDLRARAVSRLEDKLRADVQRTSTIESKLLSDLQRSTREATSAGPKFQRADELKMEIEHLQARYAAVDERTRNIELESGSPGSVHLFSAAMAPLEPEPSKAKKFGPLLLPLSLLMGVLAVVGIDLLDPRIYSAGDLERVLKFPPIGMLLDHREITMLMFDECVLRLAAGVDHAARTAGVRTFVFTAVSPGAGATSIVEDLGSTLAKLGRKTLSIDASGNTNPVAYMTVKVNRTGSRTDFSNEEALQEVHSGVGNSTAVVQQHLASKLTPLSSVLHEAFKDITHDYDIVLIDATPILISAETEYLARFADVTILVTESGKTKKSDVARASRLLEQLRIPGVAAIVNKVSFSKLEKLLKRDIRSFEERANKENLTWRPQPNRGGSVVPNPFGAQGELAKADDTNYSEPARQFGS